MSTVVNPSRPGPPHFRVEVEMIGDAALMTLAGEIDLATVGIVMNRVEQVISEAVTSLAVDLGEVTFIDSTGIGALIRAQRLAEEANVRFTLTAVSRPVRFVIDVAGLNQKFGL